MAANFPIPPPLWTKVFCDTDADEFNKVMYSCKLVGSAYKENGRWPRAPLLCAVNPGVLPANKLRVDASMLYGICPLCHSLNCFHPGLVARSSSFFHPCTAWDSTAPCPGFWIIIDKPGATCAFQ